MLNPIMLKGHKISFRIKNNLMTLISIPLALALPLLSQFIDSEKTRFALFIVNLMLIGMVNSFQQASVYGQASTFASSKQMAACCLGIGLSGILMNLIAGVITLIG